MKTLIRFTLLNLALVLSSSTISSSATVYIDPTNTSLNQNGTITNPYNSWSKVIFTNGNTYLQRSGTTYTTSKNISLTQKSNITIGAYGSGARPSIVTTGSGSHIINLVYSYNITIKDLEVTSTGTWTSAITIQGTNASNNLIQNCWLHKTGWGARILSTTGGNKIIRSIIHDTRDDGIFAEGVKSIEIGYCNIYDVNKNYLVNKAESFSAGDGIQLTSTNNMNFYIHNNTIDHSSMGNKFCIIAWGNNYTGIIENNVIIGSSSKSSNGIYLAPTTGTITIRYNNLKNSGYSILSYAKNLEVYYNAISNNQVGILISPNYSINAKNNVFYNNITYGISASVGTSISLRNNIFNMNSGSSKAIYALGLVSSNNNIFNQQHTGFINGYASLNTWKSITGNDQNSSVGNPNFINPPSGDFHLQTNSIAINKGVNVNLTRDYYGTQVPIAGNPDAGIHEVGQASNNLPPIILNQAFTIQRDLYIGSFVGKVVSKDPEGLALSYMIVSGNLNNSFTINSSTGNITIANRPLSLQEFYLTVRVTDKGSLYSQATIKITVMSTKSSEVIAVEEIISQDKEINIYPNPSVDGKFIINFGKDIERMEIKVFDFSGKVVKSSRVNQTSSEVMDLSGFPKGTYLIRLNTANEIRTIKAIKN